MHVLHNPKKKQEERNPNPPHSVEFGPTFLAGNMQNANYTEKG